MDARLIPGESYLIESRLNVNAKYLGLRNERAYFSVREGKIFIVALASALERIGNSIRLSNSQALNSAQGILICSQKETEQILKH